jgi:malate dehydrogenase (oxaloacetate-decarboxylating)
VNRNIQWRTDRFGAITGVSTTLRGNEVLNMPLLNRGTAFTQEERDVLILNGLLPPHVVTRGQQVSRLYAVYCEQPNDLAKHNFLRQLQDRNEMLFYSLAEAHTAEMMPILYTPTVALGCSQFSRLYTKPRGLFLSYPQRHRMRQMLESRPFQDVDVIVVTDGERVLGIGDQGVGGMGIPIGKLSIYSLLGGIHPSRTLPIVLDVGTNNPELHKDPFYLGWRNERIGEEDYFAFVDEFVEAVKQTMPHVLLQWEDFARRHARPILERYRDKLCTFNDDIQGTAAVVLGAIYAALHSSQQAMRDQRIVIVGAGGAGTGIADYFLQAMLEDGLSLAEARRQIFLQDADGLVRAEDPGLSVAQRNFAQPQEALSAWPPPLDDEGTSWTLHEVVEHARPTILVGVSTQPGLFSRPVVEAMARHNARPILFPLSNPTSCAEGVPAEILEWSNGRALVATGAPFAPVQLNGETIPIAQVNNFYIFPGVGLGVAAVRASRITDSMLRAAARALGSCSPTARDPRAPLLPSIEDMQEAAVVIAVAVAQQAIADGLASTADASIDGSLLIERIRRRIWRPGYPALLAEEISDTH